MDGQDSPMRYRHVEWAALPVELTLWVRNGGLWPRVRGWAVYPGGKWIMNRADEWWQLVSEN